uniref:Uncharacterized protein n=1 Tax=Rhizophagus irregularis (strain DAOM 181602 / DAOM 197198 / MUCL 43194) TaxID=747089 RepID=U9SUB0_RHIID
MTKESMNRQVPIVAVRLSKVLYEIGIFDANNDIVEVQVMNIGIYLDKYLI